MSIGTVVNSETVSADDLTEPTVNDDGSARDAADTAGGTDGAAAPEAEAALVRVTKGNPGTEELAALVAVVAAGAGDGDGGDGETDTGPRNLWGDRGGALDGMPRVFSPRSYQSGGFGGR